MEPARVPSPTTGRCFPRLLIAARDFYPPFRVDVTELFGVFIARWLDLTWLMRLEGLGREAWEPEIEAARQNFKLLAEQAEKSGDRVAAQMRKEDLESAIRLARMDLSELQGLPLPSQ